MFGAVRSVRTATTAIFNTQPHGSTKVAPTPNENEEDIDDDDMNPMMQRVSDSESESDTLLGEASEGRDEEIIFHTKERAEPACGCPFSPLDQCVWSFDEAANMADEFCFNWANPLWWLVTLILALGILCGKAVHAIVGQVTACLFIFVPLPMDACLCYVLPFAR